MENKKVENLESLDYNIFLTLVRKGKIEGKDLIRLCNTSRKLNEYSSRSFQVKNSEGVYVGEPIPQYLFVILLNDKRIRIFPGQNPREIYKLRTIGGRIWGFGSNGSGQLGLGDQNYRLIPTSIPILNNIVQVSAGELHSLILDSQGRVWSFGYIGSGQLGLGDTNTRLTPIAISNLSNIVQVSTGENHSLVLDNQGRVWSFGSNASGQLGLGLKSDNISLPTLIPNLENIIQVSVGEAHSLILDDQGRVWSFGCDDSGQLGLGDENKNRNAVILPTLIPNLNNIIQISVRESCSLVLDSQGRVWSFGLNTTGQLGLRFKQDSITLPTLILNLENIVTICAGHAHSLALDNRGSVWSFGHNYDGELGLGGKETRRQFPALIPNLDNIVEINAGSFHSLALDNRGCVWSFGNNHHGQLGLGDEDNKRIPTLIPNLNGVFQISAGVKYSLVLK